MSYAAAAAKDALPRSQQAKPNPNLLQTGSLDSLPLDDDDAKVKTVSTEQISSNIKQDANAAKDKTSKETSKAKAESEKKMDQFKERGEKLTKEAKRKASELEGEARDTARSAKKKASEFEHEAKDEVRKHPKAYGTALAGLNLAILGAVGYITYAHWNTRWDRRVVSATVIGLGAWFGLQSFVGVEEYKKH